MQRPVVAVSIAAAFLFAVSAPARGQDLDRYTVSAKAGGVNAVSGQAVVRRAGAGEWLPLATRDALDAGDAVRTEQGGRVEILLSPGSYLRVGESSELELVDASLDSLRARLLGGSALLEATGSRDAGVRVRVETPAAAVVIDRKGVYRIDVISVDETAVSVREGRVLVGGGPDAVTVKGGKRAVVGRDGASVEKFDAKALDALDRWSAERAEALSQANRTLSRRALATSLAAYRRGGLASRSGSFGGLWVFDPSIGCHTFSPFSSGWSSPYGHAYGHGFGLPSHHRSGFDHLGTRPHSVHAHHGHVRVPSRPASRPRRH